LIDGLNSICLSAQVKKEEPKASNFVHKEVPCYWIDFGTVNNQSIAANSFTESMN